MFINGCQMDYLFQNEISVSTQNKELSNLIQWNNILHVVNNIYFIWKWLGNPCKCSWIKGDNQSYQIIALALIFSKSAKNISSGELIDRKYLFTVTSEPSTGVTRIELNLVHHGNYTK